MRGSSVNTPSSPTCTSGTRHARLATHQSTCSGTCVQALELHSGASVPTHASRADVDSRATACPRTPKAHGLHEHATCSSPSAARAPARRSTAAAVQGTCTHPRCRSSPLFAQRPRSTWVSLQTARQVVKTNVEELRARPVHMGAVQRLLNQVPINNIISLSLVRCGCALCRQARPAAVVRARTHTSTRAQRCLRSVHTQLAQLPYPPAPPPTSPPIVTCDLPFNAVSDS